MSCYEWYWVQNYSFHMTNLQHKIFSMICTRAVVIQRNYNIFEYQALHAKLHHILRNTAISLYTLQQHPLFGQVRIVQEIVKA